MAALALRFGNLVNVIGYKATLPVGAWHILIVITLGILGRGWVVLCHDVRWRGAVQFGDVAKGVWPLHGIRRRGGHCPRFLSAAAAVRFRFPPESGDAETEETAKP